MISRLLLFFCAAGPLLAQDGQQLFTLYCSACHGADGKGATGGTFPPLAESPWLAGDPDRAVKVVLKGLTGPVDVLGKTYNLEMPPQGAVLPDDQIAAILTYVRSSWGNQAAAVTPDFVKTIRASVSDRNAPWTSEEILKLHPLPLEKTVLTNLLSQAYSGKWSSLPDFSTLKAANVEEEHDGIISLKDSPFEDDFAIVWTADFQAPADAEYEFLLDADDAAAVILNGKTVTEIKGAGPMNGSRVRKGKIKLTKGSHKFRLEFLELSDKQGIALGWKLPGDAPWNWLTDEKAQQPKVREPIPIEAVGNRPVIYRNFITGTTPRAIGVGFPGGLNLAYSADDLAPELLWTGKFIDGGPKWVERGTDNNPPAGENVVALNKSRTLPTSARFKGYKLDPAGNPTFIVQIGQQILRDSWAAESGALVRKLSITGPSLEIQIPQPPELTIDGANGKTSLQLNSGQPVTLTYRWK
ncbi:c-type cytochrome [Luteolibacter yonseiensis]|uniref:C-type cytochrome n=1 Tax=Luteolibacter yonseiensis TaxID=1144680 RepID=A0A934R4T8_9BACT|nr:c-type cytochrome [Luteolibacter yonseiensis]MBK1816028.1 c-type cytochrome [Luteolibacter yonseiensis]